jgi:hypothetical protein
MTFNELMQRLEAHLGHHQIPLHPAPAGMHDLFEFCALHHELMIEIALAIYKRNDCRALSDSVARTTTFEALAPIRLRVLRSPRTDVDLFNLMEELCRAVDTAFGANETAAKKPAGDPARQRAPVVSLDQFRARRLRSSA